MYCLVIHFAERDADALAADLWEMGACGVEEQGEGDWRAFFADRSSFEALRRKWPQVAFEEQQASIDENLNGFTGTADDAEPIWVGSRFLIAPSPDCVVNDNGRLRINVQSVTAFGTGRHETTQMALRALETVVAAGQVVVDAGCGSGILAEAARLLAPVSVVACDIDEHAVNALRRHFAMPVFLGSVDALRSATADLVLANISRKAVDALAAEIKRVLRPGGRVLIGGFLENALPVCYRPVQQWKEGDWLCWLCERDGIVPLEGAAELPLRHPAQWW